MPVIQWSHGTAKFFLVVEVKSIRMCGAADVYDSFLKRTLQIFLQTLRVSVDVRTFDMSDLTDFLT